MPDILRLTGDREHDTDVAKRVKRELYEVMPELATLREELVKAGLCKDNFSSILRVKTPAIDFNRLRDDPDRFKRQWSNPMPLTQEMVNDVQAHAQQKASAARSLSDRDTRDRRRSKPVRR